MHIGTFRLQMKRQAFAREVQMRFSQYKLGVRKGTSNIFPFLAAFLSLKSCVVISLASPNLYSRPLCPLQSAISFCHVMSYLLGLRGHCLSDWQGFDSVQYPEGLEAQKDHSMVKSAGRQRKKEQVKMQKSRQKGRGSRQIQTFHVLSLLHVKIMDFITHIFLECLQICQLFLLSFTLIGN